MAEAQQASKISLLSDPRVKAVIVVLAVVIGVMVVLSLGTYLMQQGIPLEPVMTSVAVATTVVLLGWSLPYFGETEHSKRILRNVGAIMIPLGFVLGITIFYITKPTVHSASGFALSFSNALILGLIIAAIVGVVLAYIYLSKHKHSAVERSVVVSY